MRIAVLLYVAGATCFTAASWIDRGPVGALVVAGTALLVLALPLVAEPGSKGKDE